MMDRKDLEPMTAKRAREIVSRARPNIFNELIHSTDNMIEDAAHMGKSAITPEWGNAPEGMKTQLADYYKRLGFIILPSFRGTIIYISWEEPK